MNKFESNSDSLLSVEGLRVQFHTDDGIVRAVDGVSFSLSPGETLGIVGESGSGKSVTNLAIMGLVPRPPGKIVAGSAKYKSQDLLSMSTREISHIRGKRIAMIFQDPMTALNPLLTIEQQMTEVTRLHLGHDRKTALKHAVEMLDTVGIPAASRRVRDYPHQFSGGMRQRVMIAMALSCKPDILIADEPTTALDVTIQAQILDLMRDLQKSQGTSIILITHDLGIIANICHRVIVMYAGKIVEEVDVDNLFSKPRHPYTVGLLNSIPRLDEQAGTKLTSIDGQPPDLAHLEKGCSFYPRCSYRQNQCQDHAPILESDQGNRKVACFVDLESTTLEENAND